MLRGTMKTIPGGEDEGRWGDHPYATIEGRGLMFWNANAMTMLVGFGGDAVVTGSDQNTNLVAIGAGDITAFLGDGVNIVRGGAGNDAFFGGGGLNRIHGGSGNDLIVGGTGHNELSGGRGDDVLTGFGQWDQASGGWGADRFIPVMKAAPAGPLFIRDLNFGEGDTLDLTAIPGVTRENLSVYDDTLAIYTLDGGVLNIGGVGHQIIRVGGIDAAINDGYLSVFGDFGGMG